MTASKIASFTPGVRVRDPRIRHAYQKGEHQTILYIPDPMPCITILVHGVNDVGEAYPYQEQGIVQGLNERLQRDDLTAGSYRLPRAGRDDPLEQDPDAVYYQRSTDDKLYNPVIPFYWGFREEEARIRKGEAHGQKTDRHGNRLDARGLKNGGPFANATTNIPDMWGRGMPFGWINRIAGNPTHPILTCPPRDYMILAAERLAMLQKVIRDGNPDETVNIVAHSQGTLVTLLSQAMLHADGYRSADCLILNNSPYSLHETLLEGTEARSGLQTVKARWHTLTNLIGLVTKTAHKSPEFGKRGFVRNPGEEGFAVCGPAWQAGQDRDNRGKVYLYFSPQDETVGMSRVQGIGWQGIPGQVTQTANDGKKTVVGGIRALGERFRQRLFTTHRREGKPFKAGLAPQAYTLCTEKEAANASFWAQGAAMSAAAPAGQVREITGEELPHPCEVNFGEGMVAVGPIDAAIAITNGGIDLHRPYLIDDPRPAAGRRARHPNEGLGPDEVKTVEEALNRGKETADSCQVQWASVAEGNKLRIVRSETPNEARARWQRREIDRNSRHSSIVTNAEHNRRVTAYDLAIGEGYCATDHDFFEFLCLLADWRVGLKVDEFADTDYINKPKMNTYFNDINPAYQKLVRDTWRYGKTGVLPAVRPMSSLSAIVSETMAGKVLNMFKVGAEDSAAAGRGQA